MIKLTPNDHVDRPRRLATTSKPTSNLENRQPALRSNDVRLRLVGAIQVHRVGGPRDPSPVKNLRRCAIAQRRRKHHDVDALAASLSQKEAAGRDMIAVFS